jgi:ABC-2 type transport system ATP-binding protein
VNALEIKGLTKIYKGKRGKRVEALNDLNLAIEAGEVFGFLGPNGAGKSTTIKTVMGLIAASTGEAFICGRAVSDASSRKLVGYLPENPSFYDFLTAREYLAFVGRTFAMNETAIKTESDKVLRLLELHEAADRNIRGYSKGMVQRLGIAQALLHDPDLFILDEPMSGLDPLGRALVKGIIRELKSRGKTVFFSTHITSDVEIVCDRVGVIVGGRLRAVDAVENILQSGIEGYSVQVRTRAEAGEIFAGLEATVKSADVKEVYVPKDHFNVFMDRVIKAKAEIVIIEPKRKDLEAFFLEIVAKTTL